ncbi:hypothetical protein [Novipirellula rosea]|uniref:Metallo-beta-lactamase domain-containing protein n=1 Tax=Novipirellula rosea TaxID=1031540 RepID=A0ABP8MZ53_9BACT
MKTKASVTSVKVRMYRHGFGDCFLLSFFQGKDRVFTMLIDCGIKYNTKSADVPIEDVIEDLKATLTPAGGGNPAVDVLVVTHEHWDHVSFFHPTRSPDYFGKFEIRQVWLGWTEDPRDKEAVAINSRLRDGAAALQVAVMHLKNAERDEARQFSGMYMGKRIATARKHFNSAVNEVLGFYGVSAKEVSKSGIKYKKNGKISVVTEAAMSHIIELGKKSGGIKYFSPGDKVDPRALPPGVNVYVLGPPRSSLINKSNPSGGSAHETYLGIDHTGLSGFIDGMLQLGAANPAAAAGNHTGPFGGEVGINAKEAKKDPFFQETYFAKTEEYRLIEHSWLDIAGQFALQLDGAINNTSLVLAIELAESGNVLLFPGDAQVGSWLSWHDLKWKVGKGPKAVTRTTEDLLNNTVLYKVSHHGSHNATIKAKGLAMMTHPDLVAMIPEKEDSYNGILYKPLLDELQKRCKGRVLVSADVNHTPEKLLKKRPDGISAAEWKAFKKNVVVDRLYVEYTVK